MKGLGLLILSSIGLYSIVFDLFAVYIISLSIWALATYLIERQGKTWEDILK